jgi:hypothetical protein
VIVTVVALIAGAVALGVRVSGTRTLPGLDDRASESFARDPIGRLAPLDARFTERQIGAEALRAGDDAAPPEGPEPQAPQKTRTTNPALRGSPGAFPGLAPGGWVLSVQMLAPKTVRAGDEMHYRMLVGNTGTEDFRGRSFQLEWHTPAGTVGRNALEQCSLLPLDLLRALCRSERLFPTVGSDTTHQSFNSSGLIAIRPGQQWEQDWYVQVLPTTTAGTQLHNHAHLTVMINGVDAHIASDDVVVTVT